MGTNGDFWGLMGTKFHSPPIRPLYQLPEMVFICRGISALSVKQDTVSQALYHYVGFGCGWRQGENAKGTTSQFHARLVISNRCVTEKRTQAVCNNTSYVGTCVTHYCTYLNQRSINCT